MVTFGQIFSVFWRIGWLSFGGPAAQIALMHRELVDRRPWLSEAEFLRALSLCMVLPGPEAMQLATYAGWRLKGVPGGIIAGLLFVLPGAAVIAALAAAYAQWGDLAFMQALFFGVKACVVVIVLEALVKLSRKAIKNRFHLAIALAAFVAIAVLSLPFPVVIIAAALAGAMLARNTAGEATAPPPSWNARLLLFGAALWLAPLLVLWLADAGFLFDLGWFFAKLAVLTFGGAYAVLTWMTQTVVQDMGWITTPQMMDALGLAETTPGPLILVTEFVAWLAGDAQGGPAMAAIAAALCLWMTFVPSFLFIFAFAPSMEWIAARPRLAAALEGVTAGVVGVIGALAFWFGGHVLFSGQMVQLGPFALPDPAGFDPKAALIALVAGVALMRFQFGLMPVLVAGAIAGLILAG